MGSDPCLVSQGLLSLEILNKLQFFECGPVLVGTWNCCRRKIGKVKEEVEKGRNLAQGERRGAVWEQGEQGGYLRVGTFSM